jgi:hypothetical protein
MFFEGYLDMVRSQVAEAVEQAKRGAAELAIARRQLVELTAAKAAAEETAASTLRGMAQALEVSRQQATEMATAGGSSCFHHSCSILFICAFCSPCLIFFQIHSLRVV